MLVYLVRHGIAAEKTDPSSPADRLRPLTPRGVAKTTEVARGLEKLADRPSVMLTSPLLRAVETAEIFCEVLNFSVTRLRQTDSLLPESKPALLFGELAKLRAHAVICFGHAPHLDAVIAAATGRGSAFTRLKKAGVALLEFESVDPPRALLEFLFTPKVLRKVAR